MLINFTIENWMSFANPVTFTMVAGRERQHGERLPRVKKYQMRVLPITAIYGGNASGKTNLCKALNFAKNFVVKGTQPDSKIKVEPFRLDPAIEKSPSRFVFELLVDDTVFEFSFSVTSKKVIEEKLIKLSSKNEYTLYDRKQDQITFHSSMDNDPFLQFAFQGTRDNQLFLTNAVMQKVEKFKPIYDWFRDKLVLLAPDSRFNPNRMFPPYSFNQEMNNYLFQLDTGISRVDLEDHSPQEQNIIEQVLEKAYEDMSEGSIERIHEVFDKNLFVSRLEGKLCFKKLVTYHQNKDGSETKFNLLDESDGTQRLIDLLPAFLDVTSAGLGKVYIIDELDRSLHTLLSRKMMAGYLANCSPGSRSQLIFTTHDVMLMDQKILRRDEMWITERDVDGASSLLSFSDYKDVRYDKDLRKSYLQGRLGGIPRILIENTLTS